MRFDLKKFFCVLAVLGFAYAFTCFSYEANTRYTDFNFWGNSSTYMVNLSGWVSWDVNFYLTNNWDSTISGYFITVDATEIQNDVFVCGTEWQNWNVWQYITVSPNTFSLNPWSTLSGVATLIFPEWYAGEHVWCLLYVPYWVEMSWYINPISRKAIFINAMLNATAVRYQVKAFPGSRSQPWLSNIWEIRFYKWNNCVYSGIILTWDENWIATFDAIIRDDVYTVVYKWQSHLASYLENVRIGSWYATGFDFTTWANLFWVQKYSNMEDNWFRYQIAGDLKNSSWDYDFMVNGNDITVLLTAWLEDVEDNDPRDLNWDNVVNVSDVSIIWTNFEQEDIFKKGNSYAWLW